MRISTNTQFAAGAARLSDLQSALQKTQQQLSTGRRVLTPSDDPIAAAQALDITQAQSVNEQYGINRKSSRSSLSQEESTLTSVTSLLQDVRTLAVSAGNTASLKDSDRTTLANEVNQRLEELISLANADDGKGTYLFAGFQTATQPFTQSGSTVVYNGDQGQRYLQVGASRQMAMSDPGEAVFNTIKSVTTAALGTNTGGAAISGATVTSPSTLNGHVYSINFTTATTYDIVDVTTSTNVSTSNAYNSGQAISFNGLDFNISGIPASGDSFTITPKNNQSIFQALRDFVSTLQSAANTGAATTGVAKAIADIDQGIDGILTVRASVGARLKELDSLDSGGEDKNLQYAQTLSGLVDLDYAKTISEFSQQQLTLEAAQKSFMQISGLSLFKLL